MNSALVNPVLADGCQMNGDGSGWWMGGMAIWSIVFWAALIVGIVWLLRVGLGRRLEREQEPRAILSSRLAEGAITLDEYQERSALLDEPFDPRRGPSTHPGAGGRES